MLLLSAPPERHTPLEDGLALVTGTALMALSVLFLKSAGLLTGQIAGLSLLISYASGWSFGAVFFVLNLPFYVFGFLRMGGLFTLKTFIAVALLSAQTELYTGLVIIDPGHPALAALFAGVLAGTGLLVLFRHGATLGGVGIVALYLQDKIGLRAGITQLGFDAVVLALAFALFPVDIVLWSVLGGALINITITFNHRRDRYVAR